MKTRLILSLLCLTALPLAAQTGSRETPSRPLDALVTDSVWQMTTAQFEETFSKHRFDWLSAGKEGARFFGPGLSVYGGELKVSEAIVDFKEEKPYRISLSIFNRGDSSELIASRKLFDERLAGYRDMVTKKTGVQPVERKDKTSAVGARGYMWSKTPTAYLLEYSYQDAVKSRDQDFRAEFIRLRLANIAPGAGGSLSASGAGAKQVPVAKASLAANVKKDAAGGDVMIPNVPMVDQGPKGYCVVATAERVFRYMGVLVDQHELAQVADTGAGGGTSPDKMYEALNKLEGRMRVRVRVIEDWEWNKFQKLMDDYDREAKKRDKQEIKVREINYSSLDPIYERIDGETLKVAKVEKDKAGFGKFQRGVQTMVDQGIPLMWSMVVGWLPEPEIPQGGIGGHMRLIIGYNLKTNEIIYSDSWGAEHAVKRMPVQQAYAVTNGLYYMEPMK
jgi:hypothetical protein